MTRHVPLAGLLIGLAGCSGSGNNLVPRATGPSTTLYVLDDRGARVGARIVAATIANDFTSVAFGAQIAGPRTGLVGPTMIARNAVGELYVVEGDRPQIDVFAANATGDVAPIRTLAGPATGITETSTIAFDGADHLYVASYTTSTSNLYAGSSAQIAEFAANANGNAAPIRTISGPATNLNEPVSIAVDAGGTIYVGDSQVVTFDPLFETNLGGAPGEILAFPSTAVGNAPGRVFGSNAQLGLFSPVYLTLDGTVALAAFTPPQASAPTVNGFYQRTAYVSRFALTSSSAGAPTTLTSFVPLGIFGRFGLDGNGNAVICDIPNRSVDFFNEKTGALVGQVTGTQTDLFTNPTAVTR